MRHGQCLGCRIRGVGVCAALAPSELGLREALAEKASFHDRKTIFLQGDAADAVHVVTGGTVRLYRLLADGRRHIIGFRLPGDFMGLVLSGHYAFSADAIGFVTACRASRPGFAALVNSKPHLPRCLHDVTTHELALPQDHIVVLGRRTAKEKVAAFLIGLADRLGRLGHSRVALPLPMTRLDIGDYLGLTLETVSRTLSKLARENAISIMPYSVTILDRARLEELTAN